MATRPLLRIVVVLAIAVGSFLGMHQISGMEPIFFRYSVPGLKALALYLGGSYDGAAKAYREHWRADILNGGTTGDPGTDLLLSGDLDAAERVAKTELARTPGDLASTLLLAEIALEREAPKEAAQLTERALAREPESADARVLFALLRARAGAANEALDSMNLVLRAGTVGGRYATFYQLLATTGTLGSGPASERPLCLLSYLHRYLRIFDLSEARPAARYARAAIAAGDRPADAYVTLGLLSEKAGRLDDALAAFHYAIEVDPRHAQAHRLAATVYGQRGDLVNEYRMISTALAESGDSFHSEYLFDVLVNKIGDAPRAAAVFKPLVAREPRNARLHERMGYISVLLGDEPRALEHYRQAVALAPRDAVFQAGLGWALARLGKTDEAIAADGRAVELAPGWFQPHSQLLEIHHAAHQYRAAIAEAELALRLGEPNPYILMMLCNFYSYEVELERAEACVQALLKRDPGNSWALALLPKIRRDMAAR